MGIRVITWNLWDRNEHPLNAIAYATSLGADVICLQEMPASALPQLEKSKEYRFFSARDSLMERGWVHLGILVHKDIECGNHYVFKHESPPKPALIDTLTGCRHSFYESHSVHIKKRDGTECSIVNCHLRATGSMYARIDNLRAVLDAHESKHPRIITGDFNTMGSPLVNLFVIPVFGALWKELFVNEITLLKRLARERKLNSLFENVVTHPMTWRHLDHVLISEHTFVVVNKKVLRARHKSDHRGLLVDLKALDKERPA